MYGKDFWTEVSSLVKQYVKQALDDRDKRLDQRLRAIEEKCILTYCGLYREDVEYVPGNAITASGSLWVCNEKVRGIRPGASSKWKLICKRGEA